MARCIRKVENEDFWIVYCNTSDRVFPEMFHSIKEAREFIIVWESREHFKEIREHFKEIGL